MAIFTPRALVLLVLALVPGGPLVAGEVSRGPGLLQQAEQAERDAKPAEAAALYKAALETGLAPASIRIAQARSAWLEARAVGDYQPLAHLLRLQQLPPAGLTAEMVRGFEAEATRIPEGPLRTEARAFVVGAWIDRLHDPVEGERAARSWLLDTFPDKGSRETATAYLAVARRKQGHPLDALEVLRSGGYEKDQPYLDMKPVIVSQIARPIAISLVALFAMLAVIVFATRPSWRSVGSPLRPRNVLTLVYVVAIPWWIAVAYEPGTRWTFDRVALSVLAVTLASQVAGAALQERPAGRWVTRSLAVAGVLGCLGAGFLAIDRSEVLEGLLIWRGI